VLLYRRIRYGYAFCRIPLTQGKYAIVDPDDYRRLSKYKWYAAGRRVGCYYAVRTMKTENGTKHRLHMHRQILKVPDDVFVDHINRNSLDNRKANLRPATPSQNVRNRAKNTNRTFSSKYKGVSWNRCIKPWRAHIHFNHELISLGSFDSEIRAAKAYDRAARIYHGEFAVLNFPERKRPVSRIVPFIAGVLLTYLAYLLVWPDRQTQLSITYLQLTKTIKPTDFCHPEVSLSNTPLLTICAGAHKVAAMAKTLYIIDGHAHIYAAFYAPMGSQLTGPSGEPTKAAYIFTTAMVGLIQRRKPDMLAVAMDSKAPTFRSDIYPEYKANRPAMPEDLPGQIDRIEQILEAMNIPMLRVDGFEADDIIGTLAKRAGADGYDCLLCSKDKDLLQLLDEHISMYDIKNDKLMDVEAMVEKMGVTPGQFIDCLALQGDASDNVPGIPGVGEFYAVNWIKQYGSLDNLYAHADELKGKRAESLRKNKDLAYQSKKLVTIDCNVPIQVDYDDLELSKFNETKVRKIFTELGFNRLLAQLGLTQNSSFASPDEGRTEQKRDKRQAVRATKNYKLIDTQEKFEKFFAELKKQKLFAIDTETTSIDAMRADLVGMSFSWQPGQGFYLPVKAPLGSKHLAIEAVRQKLAPILANESIKKIGQNIKYDMLVLQNAQMPLKGIHFDTMVASYCLDPGRSHSMNSMADDFLDYECIPISALIGKGRNQLTFDMVDTAAACEYSAEDADVTYRLYLYLKERLEKEPPIKKLFEEVEMPLVPVLATMEYNGVSLDTRVLRKMSGEISETLKNVTERIYVEVGTVFNIDSPKQLGEVLFDRLGLVPVRGRSTDAGVLEQLSDQHPVIDSILQYRALSKLQNTYVDKLGSLINPRTGRLHASFNQTIAETGRLSSSNPNLQNIPIRTELGSKVRSAFVPGKKSDCILSADYSQIELRLLAHFSKDRAMMDAFAADRDIHSFVASQIYGVPIEQVSSEMRSRCKAVNFGIIYGQGAFGLSRSIGIGRAEAKKFIDDYFARYSSIRKFMDDCIARARRTGYAETILGRRRKIQNLTSKNGSKRSQAERLAVNTVVQGSAADMIKIAMISIQRKIDAENLPVLMLLQIHDELLFELPAAEAEEHAKWIAELMTGAIKLDVPLKVDVKYGPTWLGGK
jgi:DNA polymerase-1